jgi:hypothetical protein
VPSTGGIPSSIIFTYLVLLIILRTIHLDTALTSRIITTTRAAAGVAAAEVAVVAAAAAAAVVAAAVVAAAARTIPIATSNVTMMMPTA